jgi:nucleoside-diphosphate-sugar epimerase
MHIILTGGTGFIGSAVLRRLVQAGHDVTAIVRSETSASRIPPPAVAVSGDLTDTTWTTKQFADADAVIHTASPGDATSPAFDRAVAEAAVAALSGTGKPYVHTGGIWSWGNNAEITEDAPFAPPALTSWRGDVEKLVLDADLTGTILAPAVVYGEGRGIPTMFQPDADGRVSLVGDGTQHWTTVHVDDLADLYLLVVEQGEGLGYLVAATGENPTVREIATAAGHEAVPETVEESRERLSAAYADALLLDQQATGARARSLGWRPTRVSLIDELRAHPV